MSAEAGPTRRAVLLGLAAGVTTVGCRPHRRQPVAVLPADVAALRAAVASEQALLAAYDALAGARHSLRDFLAQERPSHEEHLRALQERLAVPSSPSPPTPSAGAVTQRELRAMLRSSGADLATAAIVAREGDPAALLASIAGSHHALAGRIVVTFSSSVSLSDSASS